MFVQYYKIITYDNALRQNGAASISIWKLVQNVDTLKQYLYSQFHESVSPF